MRAIDEAEIHTTYIVLLSQHTIFFFAILICLSGYRVEIACTQYHAVPIGQSGEIKCQKKLLHLQIYYVHEFGC